MRQLVPTILTTAALVASPVFGGWDEGVAAFKAKNYQQAVSEFQGLVQQSPDSFQGYYMLGLSLEELGRKEESLQNLRKAYDLNPNDLNTKLALAKAYRNLRRYSEVDKLLSTVEPGSLPEAQRLILLQLRGEARIKTGSSDSAVRDFELLANMRPQDAQLQSSFAAAALAADRVDKAVPALAKAVQLDPRDPDKKKTYVNALLKQGRSTNDRAAKKAAYTKAAQVAGELVAAQPTYQNLMLQMSAQIGAADWSGAVKSGEAAIAKNSGDWLAYYYVGQAYTGANQLSQAEAPLRQALTRAKEPGDVKRIYTQLGFTFEKQKEFAKAIEAYNQAGDASAVARVQENQKTHAYNSQVEEENARIKAMEEEAARLEQELKKLEGGGGGGGL